MGTPLTRTREGFERQFGVNHVAHFVLSSLLLPAMVKSSTRACNSRIIFLASSSHRISPVLWDDPNFDVAPSAYDPFVAYGQSKTANIWTANYIDRVFGARGVHALAVHPGAVFSGLFGFTDPALVAEWANDPVLAKNAQTPEQGAATVVWAVVGNVWEGKGGKYLANCRVAPPTDDYTSILSSGVAPWAYDTQSEDRLWMFSEDLTGVHVRL